MPRDWASRMGSEWANRMPGEGLSPKVDDLSHHERFLDKPIVSFGIERTNPEIYVNRQVFTHRSCPCPCQECVHMPRSASAALNGRLATVRKPSPARVVSLVRRYFASCLIGETTRVQPLPLVREDRRARPKRGCLAPFYRANPRVVSLVRRYSASCLMGGTTRVQPLPPVREIAAQGRNGG